MSFSFNRLADCATCGTILSEQKAGTNDEIHWEKESRRPMEDKQLPSLLPRFLEAAHRGETSMVNEMLAGGLDVNASNAEGLTALMYAAIGGWPETATALLAAGADVNQRAWDGATALMKASLWGHARVVSLLLEYGADATVRDADGWTALTLAAEKGNQAVCQLLCKS